MNELLGCLFGAVILAIFGWVPFFYSGISLLYMRQDFAMGSALYVAECRYIHATGTEWPQEVFDYKSLRDGFYCPRWKWVGAKMK